jgi:uncharacterized protein (DUF1015 family)
MQILPFDAQLVRPDLAERVVVPSFDAMSPEQRHAVRDTEPLSFLHAMHSPGEGALARSRDGLDRLLAEGVYPRRLDQALFVYRLTNRHHAETGIVCAVPASSFAPGGDVLSHEDTRPEMVSHLAYYLREVRVSSSPVKTVFSTTPAIDRLLGEVTAADPALRAGDPSDLCQELWPITEGEHIAEVVRAFDEVDRAYITDGHHRSAAALAVGPDTPVLVALFPDHDVRIVQFNRLVRPVSDTSRVHAWLTAAEAVRADHPPSDLSPGELGVYVDGGWWRATLPRVAGEPPETLDPAVLQTAVLGPTLGVDDPGGDPRLSFVPGAVPLEQLERRAADDGVAFAMAPVTMDEVKAVADRGRSMPPKSTYFEPKPRSGLLLLRL